MKALCARIYPSIDKFINARMLEFYGLPIIFKNLEYIKKVNMDIINKANLVRGIMYRTHYSQEYRKSSFERFEECFEEIFNNEQKRLEFMLGFNWKHNIKEIE